MKPQVLITRDSQLGSGFKALLEKNHCEVICESFIETKTVDLQKAPPGDWVFFSSPRVVKHYFEIFKPDQNQRYAALSTGTAEQLKKYASCDFEGKKTSEESVKAFSRLLKEDETVVIPRSDKSVRRLQCVLKPDQYTEFILYLTLPALKKLPRKPEIAVFTSPLNVVAYAQSGNLFPAKTVAIGETTAEELLKKGLKPLVSKGYTPNDLAGAVKQFL